MQLAPPLGRVAAGRSDSGRAGGRLPDPCAGRRGAGPPARPGVHRAAGVGARAGDRAGGEADRPARGRACRRRGRAPGRGGRARARREPRQLSRPSVGPAGDAAGRGRGRRRCRPTAAPDQPGPQATRQTPEDRTRGPRPGRADADGPDRAGGAHPRAPGGRSRPRARAISSRASPCTSTTRRSGRSFSPRPSGSEPSSSERRRRTTSAAAAGSSRIMTGGMRDDRRRRDRDP